jgi:hypothetical protein
MLLLVPVSDMQTTTASCLPVLTCMASRVSRMRAKSVSAAAWHPMSSSGQRCDSVLHAQAEHLCGQWMATGVPNSHCPGHVLRAQQCPCSCASQAHADGGSDAYVVRMLPCDRCASHAHDDGGDDAQVVRMQPCDRPHTCRCLWPNVTARGCHAPSVLHPARAIARVHVSSHRAQSVRVDCCVVALFSHRHQTPDRAV